MGSIFGWLSDLVGDAEVGFKGQKVLQEEPGVLYPRESETRQVKDLGGIWDFKVDEVGEGYRQTIGTAPSKY